jgi:serine/threonine-protein kinase
MGIPGTEGRSLPLSSHEVLGHLEEILGSRAFASTDRLRRFLRLIVERTVAEQVNNIKEYSIGVEVFGRAAEYDPRTDPTVRVHAGKLRDRLREFYATEGVRSCLRIDVPKGTYVPVFTRVREPDATDIASAPGPSGSRQGFARTVTWKVAVALIFAALATGVFVSISRQPAARSAIRSVAVLPFVNHGPNPEDDYISDSLTDEVINVLGREKRFQVLGRTSAFAYKGKAVDVRQIGKTLGVDAIVEGSFRRDGEQLRMTVQIVGTSDGYQLWSGTWEHSATELILLRDDLAAGVASALSRGPALGEEHSVKTRNIQAFDAYLLGRFFANKLDPKSLNTAISYYEQAIAADPQFADAWAGLANARSSRYVYADEGQEIYKAREAAYRALEIDPDSSEAAASLAWIKGAHDYDWNQAERLYLRALALNPNDAATHNAFGITHLAPLGRLEQAISQVRRAHELDPLSVRINNSLALCYYYLRQYDRAIDQFHKTIQMDPTFALAHLYLGYTYAEKGMYSEAIQALRTQPTQVWEGPNLGALAYVHARCQRQEEARRLWGTWSVRASSITESARVGSAVWFYLGFEQRDELFESLNTAVDRHWFWVNSLKIRPMFDSIRSDPRYKILLQRMNIPE